MARLLRIARGDIVWADLEPTRGKEQAGRRPVLVLSHDVFNQRSGTIIAMALTSQPQRAGFPLTLELSETKLQKKSCVKIRWIKISQIRTLSVDRISSRLGHISPEELATVIEGLNEIIGG